MSETLSFKNRKLHYKDTGKGKTIVLLHGFMESLDIWNAFTTELSSAFRIISIDLPGHGKSEIMPEMHTMDFTAACVIRVLDHLKSDSFLLVGHSMGGYVSLALAAHYSSRVKGLVLFHSHAAADSPETRENRDRMILAVRANHSDFIQQFIPELFAPENVSRYETIIADLKMTASSMSAEGIIAAIEGMKDRPDRRDFLARTNIPVLFILGKKDLKIPFNKTVEQISLPNDSEALILGNVGHMGFIEAKEETQIAIRCFAEKVL